MLSLSLMDARDSRRYRSGYACSFAGRSLIVYRADTGGPDSPVPDVLVRPSVGIEEPDDLIADPSQAWTDISQVSKKAGRAQPT